MQITIKPNTYILFVLLLFLIPLPWLTAWLIAAAIHDLCHIIAVKLCGGMIYQLSIGLGGANMQCSAMTDSKCLISILAGPVGGFVLVLLGRWLPRVTICSWLLSVYNMLPVLPLDGGRALQILMRYNSAFDIFEKVFLIFLTAIAVYIAFILNFGVLPLAIICVLWVKNRKRPCKEGVCKVQ